MRLGPDVQSSCFEASFTMSGRRSALHDPSEGLDRLAETHVLYEHAHHEVKHVRGKLN